MTADQTVGLVWGLGALALVGSALVARRLPVARLGLMAMIWIAIFAVAISLVILWGMLGHRAGRQPPSKSSSPSRMI